MEHAEEADLGSKMSRIAGDLKHGHSARVKEQALASSRCVAKQCRERRFRLFAD
jgi:hypothetical protein